MSEIILFVGTIRALPESGRPTGIYKQRLDIPAEVGMEGFTNDQQADRRVHGGPEKAIHLYPAGHYPKLAARFPDAAAQLVPGSMGENISSPDLDESSVRIGDVWQLGSCRLQVCQPRNPCWKIDERFACDGMAAFIAEHGLTGWYFRILSPGHVSPGDALHLHARATHDATLADAMRLWREHRPALEALEVLSESPGLAGQWKTKIDARIQWLRQNNDTSSPFHVKPENQ